jgi:hypothetical protein
MHASEHRRRTRISGSYMQRDRDCRENDPAKLPHNILLV